MDKVWPVRSKWEKPEPLFVKEQVDDENRIVEENRQSTASGRDENDGSAQGRQPVTPAGIECI